MANLMFGFKRYINNHCHSVDTRRPGKRTVLKSTIN